MNAKNNIVEQIRARIAKMIQESPRGVILQPGGMGDCILTLPLAEFMKEAICKGGLDIIGHTEYIGILPGRSCVESVKSMDAMELHRLFEKKEDFELAEPDESGLIMSFADYTWIVTFLGEADSDFEQNLIFTANCSHSAEVMTLAMKPKEGERRHISDFYKEQFAAQSGITAEESKQTISKPLIKATQADRNRGREILDEAGVSQTSRPVIIHPGSGGKHKCWGLENFLAISRKLSKEGVETVFVLGPAEEERLDELIKAKIRVVAKILANLTLREVVCVFSSAKGYIGNDSGITHLAGAMGLPTVAVFGPTDPAIYGPVGPAVTILRSRDADFTTAVSEELQEKAVSVLIEEN